MLVKFSGCVLLLCVSVVLNSAVDMVICNSLIWCVCNVFSLDMVLHVVLIYAGTA